MNRVELNYAGSEHRGWSPIGFAIVFAFGTATPYVTLSIAAWIAILQNPITRFDYFLLPQVLAFVALSWALAWHGLHVRLTAPGRWRAIALLLALLSCAAVSVAVFGIIAGVRSHHNMPSWNDWPFAPSLRAR